MKTSSIVASVLFGSMAAAAPMLDKRAYVTHTATLIQTEVTYTTVYADEPAKPSAAFFEQQKQRPSNPPAAAPTQAAPTAQAPPPVQPVQPSAAAPVKPSSQPQQSAAPTKPATTQAPALPAAPTQAAPKPSTSAAAPAAPSAAPAPAPAPKPAAPAASAAPAPAAPGAGAGGVHSGGSLTLHYFGGALGSCGKPIPNSEPAVALGSDLYGPSTYDKATGNPTNKWCGMKINITYKGKTVPATILDKCDGCTNGGLDASQAVWKALTGTETGERLYGMTWTAA